VGEAPRAAGPAESILVRLEHFGVRLGLERIRKVLVALGDPQLGLRTVLVAGTNGKGSTAAWLSTMAAAAGYRVGLFTSPHLESPRERIRIDGLAIDEGDLGRLLETVVGASEERCGSPPTYFEALTAAAYLYFVERGVELAVLEVGLGGRLDATNTAEPELSIVTSVAFDHLEHLGTTLAGIAREKAGIFRRARPALCWYEHREVGEALARAASAVGADLTGARELVTWQRHDGGAVTLSTPGRRLELCPSLPGEHQLANLSLAVLAAQLLQERGFPRLDAIAVKSGARRCSWPGRLETVTLPDAGGSVILDAAHNPAGAAALARHLHERGTPFDLLFGALRHKQAESTLLPLLAEAREVALTEPPSERALPLAELPPVDREGTHLEPRWEIALDRCLERLAERPLVVCGSLYLVGAVREGLRRRFGVPLAAADVDVSGDSADRVADV
jgi:dihydrofolate synthase/folylpolyglutamate synthase